MTWQERCRERQEKLRNGTWVDPELKLLQAQDIDREAFKYPLTKDTFQRRKAAYASAEQIILAQR